jgi:hypothetical protein
MEEVEIGGEKKLNVRSRTGGLHIKLLPSSS